MRNYRVNYTKMGANQTHGLWQSEPLTTRPTERKTYISFKVLVVAVKKLSFREALSAKCS